MSRVNFRSMSPAPAARPLAGSEMPDVSHAPTAPSSAVPVITIDGPAASGKGTVAKLLAARLGFHYLDSGRLYRAAALLADHHNLSPTDGEGIAAAIRACLASDSEGLRGFLGSPARHASATTVAASQIAAQPAVRAALIPLQHAAARPPGLVADGRDMGSVIFPAAALKVFLTASIEARSKRRQKQLHEKGIRSALPDVQAELASRDRRDQTRETSPLVCPPNAVRIDSTDIPADDIAHSIIQQFQQSRAKPRLHTAPIFDDAQ